MLNYELNKARSCIDKAKEIMSTNGEEKAKEYLQDEINKRTLTVGREIKRSAKYHLGLDL